MRSLFVWLALSLAAPAAAATPMLPLDRASSDQLASLDNVDKALADDIVALRSARGGHLTSVEELRGLDRMTPAALQSLRTSTGIVLSVTGGNGKTYDSVEQVLAEFANEPTVQQVQAWTNEYARTDPGMLKAWAANSQAFAALPRFQVEYYLKEDWDRDFSYQAVGGDLETTPTGIDQGQDYRIMLRAQWELSELVMSSERIRVINESQDAVKLRDKLLTQITRLYFDRRRHQVEMLLNPRPTLNGQVEDQLRLLELTASMDALTGGAFSRATRTGN